jgi:hypothetical protein
MSLFSDMCDAIITDLTTNVGTLNVTSETIHRYQPWSPAELLPDGRRHLGVWPVAASPSTATPLALGVHQFDQLYRVLVWEGSNSESSRGVPDVAGAAALLDLHDAVLARFYVDANQSRAGAFRVWYRGSSLPERSLQVRYFEMEIAVATAYAFT